MPIDAVSAGGGFKPIEFPSFERAAGTEQSGNKSGFTDRLTDALDNLNKTQTKADDLAIQAASGNLVDIHDYTIAATRAEVATTLTVAVKNRAVDAFQQVMNMQV